MNDTTSINGRTFFLGGRLVSCLRKKQDCISHSTTKAEYVTEANNCNQVVWMKQMLKDIRIEVNEPIVIHCDNISTMNMSKNPMLHSKTKKNSINYHMSRKKLQKRKLDWSM